MDSTHAQAEHLPRLKGAIIGLGRMGLTHLSILNQHPSVESLHVVETSTCFAKAVEKNLGVTCYRDLDELLAAEVPDFLVIATPTSSHYDIAKRVLEHGVHTFIEKPLTTSAADSAALVRLANTRHAVVQVGYVCRFNEIFQAVRQVIQSGEIGAPTHVSCEVRSPMVSKTTGAGWRSKQSEGGGCLSDIASHGIDLMNFLVGCPAHVIGASLQSLVSRGVEDRVDVLFGYEGFTGALHVNWSDPSCRKPAYRLNIDTEKGRITADQHAYKVFRNTPAEHGQAGAWNTVYITDIAQPVRMYVRGNEFTRQLDYFIESVILKRSETISDIVSAMEVDEVIEKIRREAGLTARVQ
jgi:scyllo-inositol 2-dehydrogenase (NADP+)